MRGLIAIVTIMTLLLVGGACFLAWTLFASVPASPAAAAAIALPQTGSVRMMSAWKDGLALYISDPGGDFVYLWSPRGSPARLPVVREASGDGRPVQAP